MNCGLLHEIAVGFETCGAGALAQVQRDAKRAAVFASFVETPFCGIPTPPRSQRVTERDQLTGERRKIHFPRLPGQMYPPRRRMRCGFKRTGLTQENFLHSADENRKSQNVHGLMKPFFRKTSSRPLLKTARIFRFSPSPRHTGWLFRVVEHRRFELLTSSLRTKRSTN